MSDVNFAELLNATYNNSVGSLQDFTAETAANGTEIGSIIAMVAIMFILLGVVVGSVALLIYFIRKAVKG